VFVEWRMVRAVRNSLLTLVVGAEMILATAVAFPTADRLFLAGKIEPAVGMQRRCTDLLRSRIEPGQDSSGPSTINVSVRDGHSVRIDLAEGTATANGCLWNGTLSETGEAAILMAWTDGRLTGSICYRGKILAIAASDGKLAAAPEFEPMLAAASHARVDNLPLGFTSADRSALDSAADLRGHGDQPAPRGITPFSDQQRAILEAHKITIDLMILYTRRAESRYVLDMGTLIATAIEQINASFRNSGVGNVSLRLAHTEPIGYVETELGHFDHLYRMVDGVGQFDRVGKLRDDARADIVGLIVDDPSQCGLATRVAPDPEEAYFVVHHSCALLSFSMAHEIGHILGARHEPQIDAGNAPASYGFGYVNGNQWRDIMSYAQSCGGCPRLPHWSNPRLQYQGQPTGTRTSDAARVILEQAGRVARFR